jgi:hypothetical protein
VAVKTDKMAAVVGQHRTAVSDGESQNGSVGDALLGLPGFLGRQDIVAE